MAGYSAKLPISTDDPIDGIALLKTIPEVAKQNFKMLLLTNPGERVWDAEYGVGLNRFLFENASAVKQQLSSRIKTQTNTYLPYITISELGFNIDEDQNLLNLKITFFISGYDGLIALEI